MPRHRRSDDGIDWEELFHTFRHAPWWAGPLVVVGLLLFFFVVFPLAIAALGTTNELAKGLASFLRVVMPIFGGFLSLAVLLVWGLSLVAKAFDRKRLDSQRGPRTIDALTWQQFELLLAEAMRRKGYAVQRPGGRGGGGADGGVDLRLTRHGETTLVQCKHWKAARVGVRPVRELRGVMVAEGAQRGVLVASGSFTAEARSFAAAAGVELIDGKALWPMIRSVQNAPADVSKPQPPTPNAPPVPSEPAGATPPCPRCGSAMVRRVARQGPNAGGAFLGCSRYPACKATLRAPGEG